MCDRNCKDCYYYKPLYSGAERCCHYLLIEGKKRPCDPGKGCTVKIKGNYYRKKTKGEAND